ncbi:MAG: hypothetical protein PHH28_10370 [Desulfuromonadaceae bacterium]|nr:hypothetical protein [Desulfuromonadaceae bacterium]
MKIFNEEPVQGKLPQEFILIIDKKEAVALVDIVEAACKSNPRKSGWKKIQSALTERLACY